MSDNKAINRMKNLVDISAMVTHSTDFFEVKDKIIDKMLEVVYPTKACVNLFYNNDYTYAYLVCSQTLEAIPNMFHDVSKRGIKIDFNEYPEYVHESVGEKKIVYIKNVFNDDRSKDERELAKEEGYTGRIVFPLVVNYTVVGFMTCFLTAEDSLDEKDVDFISSVASLVSLSIDITTRNNNTQILIHKLRGAIASINDATKKLYHNRNINEFLEHLSKQACHITKSKEAIIIIEKTRSIQKIFSVYNVEEKNQSNIYPIMSEIRESEKIGAYDNERIRKENDKIDKYIYYRLTDKDEVFGYIVCANSNLYTKDDLNILSILAKQVHVAIKLFEYNIVEVNHQVLANELEILNKQQKLLMSEKKVNHNFVKNLDFYHKPARVVGGDFFYSEKISKSQMVYIVADVMGHGIVSNYVVALIKGAFKVLSKTCKSPGEIMTKLNEMLFDEFDKMGTFTTCLISMIDTNKKTIKISNAGHYSPIVLDNEGQVRRDLKCKKGIPIGILDGFDYEENTFNLEEISTVWMYTDGLIEVRNTDKEEYGIERVEAFAQKNYLYDYEIIVQNLEEELTNFAQKDNYEDDILLVMLSDIKGDKYGN